MKKLIGMALVSLVVLAGCVSTHPVEWKTLPDYPVTYEKAWNVVLDVVTEDWELAVVEKESGYIKSSWTILDRDIYGKTTSKCMFDCKFTNKDPVKIKLRVRGIKVDTVWGGTYETGFPEKQKALLEEINGRLSGLTK